LPGAPSIAIVQQKVVEDTTILYMWYKYSSTELPRPFSGALPLSLELPVEAVH
jgi:hypothetical protein